MYDCKLALFTSSNRALAKRGRPCTSGSHRLDDEAALGKAVVVSETIHAGVVKRHRWPWPFVGDAVQASTLADDLANRFPDHTIVQSCDVPTIRAQLALSHDDPSGAVEVLQAAVPYELSNAGALYPVYVRGEAYLAAHNGKEAGAEFQKNPRSSGVVVNSPIGALAHLGLGRAYALSGDKTKAKSAYQDFLTIWKDADPRHSNAEAGQSGVCEAPMITCFLNER